MCKSDGNKEAAWTLPCVLPLGCACDALTLSLDFLTIMGCDLKLSSYKSLPPLSYVFSGYCIKATEVKADQLSRPIDTEDTVDAMEQLLAATVQGNGVLCKGPSAHTMCTHTVTTEMLTDSCTG